MGRLRNVACPRRGDAAFASKMVLTAFASSQEDEADIFKGDQYALINFSMGTTNDRIV